MNKEKRSLIISIFLTIFLVLFTINVYLYLVNPYYFLSFSDLFRIFESAPKLDSNVIQLAFNSGITDDWGMFNFFRDFLNGFWQIIGVITYVCVGIVNGAIYLFI